MPGVSSWRSLRWAMARTVEVAVASILVRWAVGPLVAGSRSSPWVALALLLAVVLINVVGRAIAALVRPRNIPAGKRCPRCARAELRPVQLRGRGLFEPVERYRCGACWTSYELAGEALVEVGRREGIGTAGIRYLDDLEPGLIDASGIEFLGEVGPVSRTSPARSCPEGMRSGVEGVEDRGAARR